MQYAKKRLWLLDFIDGDDGVIVRLKSALDNALLVFTYPEAIIKHVDRVALKQLTRDPIRNDQLGDIVFLIADVTKSKETSYQHKEQEERLASLMNDIMFTKLRVYRREDYFRISWPNEQTGKRESVKLFEIDQVCDRVEELLECEHIASIVKERQKKRFEVFPALTEEGPRRAPNCNRTNNTKSIRKRKQAV